MHGARSSLLRASRSIYGANCIGSSPLATTSKITIEAHRLLATSGAYRDVPPTPADPSTAGNRLQGPANPAETDANKSTASKSPNVGDRYWRRQTYDERVAKITGTAKPQTPSPLALEQQQTEGGHAMSAAEQEELDRTAAQGIDSFEQTLFDMRQLPESPDDIHEEDMLASTLALWEQLQPLKAIVWAAEVVGHEKETSAMILPHVNKLMKDYMELKDPKPLTTALLGLITGFPGQIRGSKTHEDEEIDTLTVLTVVLRHLICGGAMSVALGERTARFYLNVAKRTDARIARTTDADKQFTLRWNRDPIDAAFSVILKGLQVSRIRLKAETVATLMELAKRRKSAQAARDAIDDRTRMELEQEKLREAERATQSLLASQKSAKVVNTETLGSPFAAPALYLPSTPPSLPPSPTPSQELAHGAETQARSPPVQEATGVDGGLSTSTDGSGRPLVIVPGMTSKGTLEVPIKDLYVFLVDAILATQTDPDERVARFDRVQTALPFRIKDILRQHRISQQTYALAAQNEGHILLRRDSQGNIVLDLDDAQGRPLRPAADLTSRRTRLSIEEVVWAPMMTLLGMPDIVKPATALAQSLPSDRTALYRRASVANLVEYVEAGMRMRMVQRLPGDVAEPFYIRMHPRFKHRTPYRQMLQREKERDARRQDERVRARARDERTSAALSDPNLAHTLGRVGPAQGVEREERKLLLKVDVPS